MAARPATPPAVAAPAEPATRRASSATRQALVAAARAEFFEAGHDGTDTNRIARRAGHSPQTFYRHFADKRAVFLEVYRAWVGEAVIGAALRARSVHARAVALVAAHRSSRRFRRSLRALSATDPELAAVRAEERDRQLRGLAAASPRFSALARAEQVAWLLEMERWLDAIADDELEPLGVSRRAALAWLEMRLAAL